MDFRAILMGLAFAFMWSSAFTSARVIVEYAPPMVALSLRFLISGLLALLIARLIGQWGKVTKRQWVAIAVFGICQNALYLGLNFVAMQWLEASLASIIASTMPLIVALIGWGLMGEKLRPLAVAGLLAGVVGVSIIMGARFSGGVSLPGVILCAIGVLSLAIATLAVRNASAGGNLLMIVGLQMLVGSAALALPAALFEVHQVDLTWQLGVAFAYTTLVPGLAATWLWFVLVSRIGAVRAATFHFLNPFFGVAVAAALLGEHLENWDIIGVIIIAGGILAVQLSKQPAKPA